MEAAMWLAAIFIKVKVRTQHVTSLPSWLRQPQTRTTILKLLGPTEHSNHQCFYFFGLKLKQQASIHFRLLYILYIMIVPGEKKKTDEDRS